jgi:hypothetical protein
MLNVQTCEHYLPGDIPGAHFCWRLSRPQGHTATGRNVMGNRTRDLPACSEVPQLTGPARARPSIRTFRIS